MQRIALAPVQASDAADLIAANIASRAYHAPWTTLFTDQAGFDAWFANTLTDRCVSLVVRHRQTAGIIGVINFTEIVRGGFQSAYTGFAGMAAFARQGLMTEGLKAAVTFAFTELDLHRLEANIQPINERSLALVRRAGFRKEGFSPHYLKIGGVWRDHERWAITREIWPSLAPPVPIPDGAP